LKQKIDFWVALIVNESEKLKGETKSKNIRVAEEKVIRILATRLMLGLLISVIKLVDEVADAKDEVLAGRTQQYLVPARLEKA
jgi:hypothetical protein